MNLPSERILDSAQSEELVFDKKFVSRWTDRCVEQKRKYGQQFANSWAKEMFSPAIIRLINKEIEKRKGSQ